MANTLLINRTALGTPSGGEYPDWNNTNDPNINNLDYGELAWNNGTQKLLIARVSNNTGGKTLTPIVRMQGTNNQISVTESSGTFTVGLPTSISLSNNITVGNDLSVAGDIVVTGNLTVNGTSTTVNSTTVTVDDKNIELGSVANPTDTTANGGGITLKGATDKTILWSNANNRWDYNQGISVTGNINATTYTGGNVTEWDSAYSDRMKWDGGATGLNAGTARASLDLEIGTDVQAYDADLTALAGLAKTDSHFIVGNGSTWVAESGSTVRTSLGLGNVENTALSTATIDGGTF